jgi:FkbM family methyltransferase
MTSKMKPDEDRDEPPELANIALNRPTSQSSTSNWSHGSDPGEDSQWAVNGKIDGDDCFHTDREQSPWWQVDLEDLYAISEIRIFNRLRASERLRAFSVLTSMDARNWTVLHAKDDDHVFAAKPYVVQKSVLARLVRVRLDRADYLHFRECQVFGTKVGPDAPEYGRYEQAQLDAVREGAERLSVLANGRQGEVVPIGNVSVFLPPEEYGPTLTGSISEGTYENKERGIISKLLKPSDRVLEIGTAIGVVSMTAAKIVGQEAVRTFDASARIVADARRNFDYNGLSGIRSDVRMLVNRLRRPSTPARLDFHIARDFWASRAQNAKADIVETVQVETGCLEDEIALHKATVLVCDIEGGEIDLLIGADLRTIRLIVLETHPHMVGKEPTDRMIRYLVGEGFSVNFFESGKGIAVLER